MSPSSAAFTRDIQALEGVFALVDEFLVGNGLDDSHRFLLEFVLEELFTNMVKYNPQGSGCIGIELALQPPELKIQLTDPDCAEFDIRVDAPAVDISAPLEARDSGGLGIHLVKKMVDRIEYDHNNRTGTVRLYKQMG